MRLVPPLLALACIAALSGCAIVVTPNEGDVRMRTVFSDSAVEGNGVGEIRGDYARISVNGPGVLQAGGVVRSLNARVAGSGNVDLASLSTQDADLAANGSGGIRATVKQSLVAHGGGSGGIRVYGKPAQRSITGNAVHLLG